MVLSRAGSGLMLTLSSGNGEVPAWQTFLDLRGAADLDANTSSGRWRVTVAPPIGSSASKERARQSPPDRNGQSRRRWARQWVSTGTGDAFGWAATLSRGGSLRGRFFRWRMSAGFHSGPRGSTC